MSDLRQQVRAAIERGESDVCGCDDHRGPVHDIATDLVLAEFAGWLAERARAVREAGNVPDPQDGLSWYDRGAAVAALESAAEELAPRERGR